MLQAVRTAAPRDAVRKVAESLQQIDSLQHYRASVSGCDIDLFARSRTLGVLLDHNQTATPPTNLKTKQNKAVPSKQIS